MRRAYFACASLLCALALTLAAPAAHAHQLGTAVIHLDAVNTSDWIVRSEWQSQRNQRGSVGLHTPVGCKTRTTRHARVDGEHIREDQWRCQQPIKGQILRVFGLSPALPDALILFNSIHGAEQVFSINRRLPQFTIAHAGNALPLGAYFEQGLRHIATGWDHLIFVLLLFWASHPRFAKPSSAPGTLDISPAGSMTPLRLKRLIAAITGFTLAHAVSLTGVLMYDWQLPSGPVEVLIAFSLVLLAAELLRTANGNAVSSGLQQLLPMAFGFGLLHGLGFAGALADIGLPEHARWAALALFNLGIECGQLLLVLLLVVGLVLGSALGLVLRARLAQALPSGWAQALPRVHTALIFVTGSVGAYWSWARSASFLTAA